MLELARLDLAVVVHVHGIEELGELHHLSAGVRAKMAGARYRLPLHLRYRLPLLICHLACGLLCHVLLSLYEGNSLARALQLFLGPLRVALLDLEDCILRLDFMADLFVELLDPIHRLLDSLIQLCPRSSFTFNAAVTDATQATAVVFLAKVIDPLLPAARTLSDEEAIKGLRHFLNLRFSGLSRCGHLCNLRHIPPLPHPSLLILVTVLVLDLRLPHPYHLIHPLLLL
mmetsp:Transcript_5359/g.11290  ORF Transcript_5359/g.11290 Transcript_5359/m.11290 type:complete len:229 (-) Transcript_5359:247-933(-)